MLVNWTDILDGEIVNAGWAVAQMVVRPRTSRQVAAGLERRPLEKSRSAAY